MRAARIVVGAGYGDEGKGKTVDFLSKDWADLVVRANGGAQAAHTVRKKDGTRHVFGHFGSGTLNSVPTYLAPRFVVHPMLFAREYSELQLLGYPPVVSIDKNCIVSTVFDAVVNTTIESLRGTQRHGSCGVGFNEAITRHLSSDFKITAAMLYDWGSCLRILERIWKEYTPQRMLSLHIPEEVVEEIKATLDFDKIVYDTHNAFNFILEHAVIVDDTILTAHDNVVFEGAQGLLLDEFAEGFPHVTRSRTGTTNPLKLIRKYDLEKLEVYYVTRPYLTRHGAGPLNDIIPQSETMIDMTNVPNPHQGAMRFGVLDIDQLANTINKDKGNYCNLNNVETFTVVNCMDQMPEEFSVRIGSLHTVNHNKFVELLHMHLGDPVLLSYSEVTPDEMLKMYEVEPV